MKTHKPNVRVIKSPALFASYFISAASETLYTNRLVTVETEETGSDVTAASGYDPCDRCAANVTCLHNGHERSWLAAGLARSQSKAKISVLEQVGFVGTDERTTNSVSTLRGK